MSQSASKTFCILPFTHLSTSPTGDLFACCRSWPAVGNIRDMSLQEAWNSDQLRRIRRQVLNGERPPECHSCFSLEDIGATSMRQTMLKNRAPAYPDALSDLHNESSEIPFSMPFAIPVLELKLSNLCNLRCRMCKPGNSAKWTKDHRALQKMNSPVDLEEDATSETGILNEFFKQESFLPDLERLAPHFDSLEFAGGEPLIDPLHYQTLDRLTEYASRIHLKYSTNLTTLGTAKYDVISYWKRFKSVELTISIDGHHGLYEYIRTDGHLKDVEKNLTVFRDSFPQAEVRSTCTVQIYNVFHLPEIFAYFARSLKTMVHSSRVVTPPFLNTQALPKELKHLAHERIQNALETLNESYSGLPTPAWWVKKIQSHLKDNQIFMSAQQLPEKHWEDFLSYTRSLDQLRGTDVTSVLPELKDWL